MNIGAIPACRIVAAVFMMFMPVLAWTAPDFIDLRHADVASGDASAGKTKASACMACHGAAGIALVPTFPDLAGQKFEYLYWSLVEFQRAPRPDLPMPAQVAKLTDLDLRDLAAYFASLAPAATAADPRASRGAALFRNGDPARGVPPCQGCHGIDAGGHALAATDARYRAYPSLRGQHAAYVLQRLKDFRAGKRVESSNDLIMRGVARNLDDDTMQDIATWLQAASP